MKRISTTNWLFVIVIISIIFEAVAEVNTGFFDMPIVRVLVLLWLFWLTMKGYRWARYFLANLYGLVGIVALISVVSVDMSTSAKFELVGLGIFGLVSSTFLFRAKMLREFSNSLESGC